jgi:pyrophosphatase PpaX
LARPRKLAILFDLDGTLVDTVPFILEAVHHAFEGAPRHPTDAEWIAGIGTPLRTQLAEFATGPDDVERLFERYRAYWLAHHDGKTRAFPGALEVVRALAADHPIGVVTAKNETGALRTLRHTGLFPFVNPGAIIGADSCANAKPHPEPVLLALSRLDRRPDEALLLGDSAHDLAAARAAGALAVGATWGASPREALSATADRILDDVRALPALVEEVERSRAG